MAITARHIFFSLTVSASLATQASLVLMGSAQAAPFRMIITETETPLVPNSVVELSVRSGAFTKAGVEVELVRVGQTPSAIAALKSGQGEMANIALDSALQLVARNQMRLKGIVSPDKALPFVLATTKDITSIAQLEGKNFGVARVGSVDDLVSRSVIAKLGLDPDKLKYVGLGQPPVRAQALAGKRIDATAVSIGIWLSIKDRSMLNMLVDQKKFYESAPFVTKLNVVTESVAKDRAKEVQAVVRVIMDASRQFAKNPQSWVEAMAQARPDVAREDLEQLAQTYRPSWSVNGGLNLDSLTYTTNVLYEDPEFKDLRKVAPAEWIDTSFIDKVLSELGRDESTDAPGR